MEKNLATGGTISDRNELFTLALSQETLREAVLAQLTPDNVQTDGIILLDGESEIVFYLNELRVAVKDSYVIFEVKLEADQTGTGSLVVPFRIGNTLKQASLTITTESLPRGNPTLSARWGTIVQEQLWFALLSGGEAIAKSKSTIEGLQLSGLYTDRSEVVFVYSQPANIVEIANYIKTAKSEGFDPGQEDFDPPAIDLEAPEPERSLFEQVLKELYKLLMQFIRFSQKVVQLAVYLIRKLIQRLRR